MNEPYWNFWKVVLAGWLIKYPGAIFRGMVWLSIISFFSAAYIHTEYFSEPSETPSEMVKKKLAKTPY